MGEKSAYYIPENQDAFKGKAEEISDLFWNKGIFLSTPDQHIYTRLRKYEEKGIAVPPCNHEFSFLEMGIADEGIEIPVPSNVYDAVCPKCEAEVYEEFTESLALGDESVPLPDRIVICSSCNHSFKSSETKTTDSGFQFARVYLWVSDIYEEDWEPIFKATVESVLGPCREIIAWDT